MSTPAKTQSTSSSCSKTIFSMVFLTSFLSAVTFGPLTLYMLVGPGISSYAFLGLISTALGIVALLTGTQSTRLQAMAAKNEAQEKIRIQEMAGLPIAPTDVNTAQSEIPSFQTQLKRNAIVSVFYTPLVLAVGTPAMGIYIGASTGSRADRQAASDYLLILLVAYPIFLGVGWRLLVHLTDTYLLKKRIDLPLSEEQRQKKEEADAQNTPRKKLMFYGSYILSTLIGIAVVLFPFLLLPSITNANISGIAKAIAVVGLFGAWYGGLALLIRRFVLPRLQTRYVNSVKEAAETVKVTATHEENEAIQQAITQMENQERIKKNAMESQMQGRLKGIAMGTMLFSVFVGLGVIIAMRGAGANADNAIWGFIVTVAIGVILGMIVFPILYIRYFSATSKFVKTMTQVEELFRRGDYAQAIPLIEAQLRELPSYEVMIPAAAVYAQAGNYAEAERLANEALRVLADTNSDQVRESRKPYMSSALALLSEIQFYQHKWDDAKKYLQQARTFGTSDALENITARQALLAGDAVTAHSALDAAAKEYHKAKKPISPPSHILRAWAFALQGDNVQADALIQQALAAANPEHRSDLAELYLLQGYIARSQHKPVAATQAFQRAIDFDPNGANGIMARYERELG